jgi:hypothetical protein
LKFRTIHYSNASIRPVGRVHEWQIKTSCFSYYFLLWRGQATPDQLGSVPKPGSIALLDIASLALPASRKRRRKV